MSNTPALSVVVPSYKGSPTIRATIESILADPYPEMEVVVLDNGALDDTSEILATFDDPRLRWETSTTIRPLAENWTYAVSLAKAPLVRLVCADDLLIPGHLARSVALLQSDTRLSLVASRYDFVDAEGRSLVPKRGIRHLTGYRSASEVVRTIVRDGGNPIGPPCSVTFRKAHFDAIGSWDGSQLFVMDLAMWVKLLEYGSFYGDPSTTAQFRIAEGTVSSQARRDAYNAQRAFTCGVATDPQWGVTAIDRVLGRAAAPCAMLRRRALFEGSRLLQRVRGGG